jgi:hypothetical protein
MDIFQSTQVLYCCLTLGPQMRPVRYMLLVAALSLTAVGSPLRSDEQEPLTTPTRDVDITYQITRPGQPAIVERRRWLASKQLRRVDGSDNFPTIFDQKTGEFTLLNTANHTYRILDAPKRMSPQKGTALKRGGESKVAGLSCIDWSWMDDTELHMACLTPDGVLLRLVADGQVVAEARSVLYAPQPPELFEVPPGYEPALAPEGSPVE